jgi:hypothetical protein
MGIRGLARAEAVVMRSSLPVVFEHSGTVLCRASEQLHQRVHPRVYVVGRRP